MNEHPKARIPMLVAAGLGMIVMSLVAALLTHRTLNLYMPFSFLTVLAIACFWTWRRSNAKGS